jgi:tetratricopeptide (TPR) repeat protein
LTGEPVLARRPSRFYFMCKKLRKHRLRIGLGAVVLVIVIVAALGGMWWSQQRRARRETAELAAARIDALHAQQRMELGDMEAGRTAAHAVRSTHPSLPDAVLVGAQALFRDRKTELASVDLERQHEGAPAYGPSRALLAEICRSRGDSARAEQLAAEATRLMPDSAEGWYLRSLATLNLADAAEFARRAISRDPLHVLALWRLARLRVQLGQLDGALEVVQQLVRLQPDDLDLLLLKGEILVRQHAFEQAVTLYTEVMGAHPECVGARLFRAQAYRRLKRFDEALADYDAIMAPEQVEPGTVPIWHRYQRAAVLCMARRAAEAAADYQQVRAVVGRPHYADARRAVILHELGRHEEATAVLEEAQREADDPWLAQIFACLSGRISPAELARAAEAMPAASRSVLARTCEAFYYAGEACLLKGERDQARAWFQRCVQTGVEFDPQVFLPTPMNEYELAEWRLEALLCDPDPTARP